MKSSTQRIRYDSQGFSNETFYTKENVPVRVRLLEEQLKYQILVVVTDSHVLLEEGTAGSIAVLKRKAKDRLSKLMGVEFNKEARPSRRGKRIGGIKKGE